MEQQDTCWLCNGIGHVYVGGNADETTCWVCHGSGDLPCIDADLYFGLSYVNYLVIPRAALQSAPVEWQYIFFALVSSLDGMFEEDMDAKPYHVLTLARRPEMIHEEEECDDCSGTGLKDDDSECPLCDGTGQRLTGEMRYETPEEVGIIDDPIPHYNRTRTRLTLKKQPE